MNCAQKMILNPLNFYFKKLNANLNGNVPNSAKLSTFLDLMRWFAQNEIIVGILYKQPQPSYINIFQTIELFKYNTLKATTTLHVSILAK